MDANAAAATALLPSRAAGSVPACTTRNRATVFSALRISTTRTAGLRRTGDTVILQTNKKAQSMSEKNKEIKKISAMVDTKKFIAEVKKRPAIYDTKCPQYNERNLKAKAWQDVCKAVTPEWEKMDTELKRIEEKNLRGKWRNMRDYFTKELKLHVAGKAKSRIGKKRKRYALYSQLSFLVPNVKANKRGKNAADLQQLKNEVEHIEIDIEDSNQPVLEYNLTGVSLATGEPTVDKLYQHQTSACEEASLAHYENEISKDAAAVIPPAQASQRTDEDDYDKMFLLSLLPSFRLIPEHVKLHVRIQIQQILASAFHPSSHHTDQAL